MSCPAPSSTLEVCDISDLDDVRRFCADLLARVDRLDVLVHNAGAMPPERTESDDGHELTVALHVLGPLLMTELLLPGAGRPRRPGRAGRPPGGMYTQKLPVDDPDYRRGEYQGAVAYARSKRMQVALTPMMQRALAPAEVERPRHAPGLGRHPGDRLVAAAVPHRCIRPVLRDSFLGADTIVWLAATEPAPPGGRFWMDRAERPAHYRKATAETEAERHRMWDLGARRLPGWRTADRPGRVSGRCRARG